MASMEISGSGGCMRHTGNRWRFSGVDALARAVGRADADFSAVLRELGERIWSFLTLSFVLPVGLLMASPSPSATAEIHTLTEHVRDPAFDDITFFLRMPSAWDGEGPERDAFGRKVPTVWGVRGR